MLCSAQPLAGPWSRATSGVSLKGAPLSCSTCSSTPRSPSTVTLCPWTVTSAPWSPRTASPCLHRYTVWILIHTIFSVTNIFTIHSSLLIHMHYVTTTYTLYTLVTNTYTLYSGNVLFNYMHLHLISHWCLALNTCRINHTGWVWPLTSSPRCVWRAVCTWSSCLTTWWGSRPGTSASDSTERCSPGAFWPCTWVSHTLIYSLHTQLTHTPAHTHAHTRCHTRCHTQAHYDTAVLFILSPPGPSDAGPAG